MNREIKFRAWDSVRNKMLSMSDFKHKVEPSYFFQVVTGVYAQIKPMQYTGLKDKNGKEIYEGDVVSTRLGVREVVFHKGRFMDVSKDKKGKVITEGVFMSENIEHFKIEVIGNIHENPELL